MQVAMMEVLATYEMKKRVHSKGGEMQDAQQGCKISIPGDRQNSGRWGPEQPDVTWKLRPCFEKEFEMTS